MIEKEKKFQKKIWKVCENLLKYFVAHQLGFTDVEGDRTESLNPVDAYRVHLGPDYPVSRQITINLVRCSAVLHLVL